MEKLLLRQLIKTALVTAPLMAVIFATPLYIFKAIPNLNPFIVFPIAILPMLFSWALNILIIAFVKAKWATSFIRVFVVGSVMFLFSGVVISFVNPQLQVSFWFVVFMRIVNILSVNSIIYVLIDLAVTKENKNKVELENANLKFSQSARDGSIPLMKFSQSARDGSIPLMKFSQSARDGSIPTLKFSQSARFIKSLSD